MAFSQKEQTALKNIMLEVVDTAHRYYRYWGQKYWEYADYG